MTRHSRVLITVIILGVGLLLAPPRATAGKKRIAVLEIEGARNNKLLKDVTQIVKARHSVLSASAFEKAQRKTKTRKLNTGGVKKVSRYLELDGVVEGMLVAEDGGYVLRLRLREGISGKTVRKFTVFLESPALTAKIRKQLAERMHKAIATLEPIIADEPNFDKDAFSDDGDDEEPAPPRRAAKKPKKQRKATPAKKAKEKKQARRARDLIGDRDIEAARRDDDEGDDFDDDDSADDDDDDSADDDDDSADDDGDDSADDDDDGDDFDDGNDFDDDDASSDDRRSGRSHALGPRTLGISISAGAAVIGRSLAFTYRADLDAPPSEYNGAFAPGAYLTGDFYPLALTGKADSVAANIGFGFDVERAIGLSSQVAGPTVMEPVNLATVRQRYGVRAQYRHNFGSKDTHPSVIVSVGYNKLKFTIDRTNAPEGVVIDVPNVVYTFLDPGIALRLPVGKKLAFVAEGRFMAITDAGAIATPEQYGQAMVTGFDADLAAEILAVSSWIVRVGATMTTIGYSFQEGAGQLSSNRDGDLASLDVGGALDRYLGGYITAGYMY